MWGIKKTSINGVDEPRERCMMLFIWYSHISLLIIIIFSQVKLMFQAPPKPGKYCWSLLIVSDSYLGVDQKVSVLIGACCCWLNNACANAVYRWTSILWCILSQRSRTSRKCGRTTRCRSSPNPTLTTILKTNKLTNKPHQRNTTILVYSLSSGGGAAALSFCLLLLRFLLFFSASESSDDSVDSELSSVDESSLFILLSDLLLLLSNFLMSHILFFFFFFFTFFAFLFLFLLVKRVIDIFGTNEQVVDSGATHNAWARNRALIAFRELGAGVIAVIKRFGCFFDFFVGRLHKNIGHKSNQHRNHNNDKNDTRKKCGLCSSSFSNSWRRNSRRANWRRTADGMSEQQRVREDTVANGATAYLAPTRPMRISTPTTSAPAPLR